MAGEHVSGVTSAAGPHPLPRAPAYASLPTARRRSVRGAPESREISVLLEVVTPILGGGAETRVVDDLDIIRVPSVRGNLRFWWRALYAARYSAASELYKDEGRVWGRAATDEGGRSSVEVRIHVDRVGDSDVRLYGSREGTSTPGAYALWPARGVPIPPAPGRMPVTRFRLTLLATPDHEEEVSNALRAWILFGGYGSRTRRGLGSLTVADDRGSWLPSEPTRNAFEVVFGLDVFATPVSAPGDTPWLGGAELQVGKERCDAMRAWTAALDWLKEFRQGTTGGSGHRAREPGPSHDPRRPSISNWPEADKIRHLEGKTNAHSPRHNTTPVWPRAGFGLPVIGQFQRNARDRSRLDEPGKFELRWRSGDVEHDRLASPLIVKALPLADGSFAPSALWLNRGYPGGEVVLRGVENSAAPFDQLVAAGDEPRFSALENKQSLRQAFLDWLHATYQTIVVAP